jgi:hypothetical protein
LDTGVNPPPAHLPAQQGSALRTIRVSRPEAMMALVGRSDSVAETGVL